MLASKIICGSPYSRVTLTWYFATIIPLCANFDFIRRLPTSS